MQRPIILLISAVFTLISAQLNPAADRLPEPAQPQVIIGDADPDLTLMEGYERFLAEPKMDFHPTRIT